MPQSRLFLSHSSKDRALTDSVAAALRTPDPGGHEGFELLVDVDSLQAGDAWPIQLHSMMAYAQAGLLLFTRAAMDRPDWVRKEAYILTWRQSLDPTFKVFYTLLDDVTPADLTKQGLDPAHIDQIQRLQSTTAAEIAAEVKRLCPSGSTALSPFEELSLKLAQHLQFIGDVQLGVLAAKLGAPPTPWQPAGVRPSVAAIASRMLIGELGDLKQLTLLINELRSLSVPADSLRDILRWVAPYWLSPEAAGRMGAVIREFLQHQRGGWAAINGRCVVNYTAERIVDKASPFRFDYRVARIEAPANRADANFYTEQICDWLRKNVPEGEYDDDNDALQAQLKAERPFLFAPIKLTDEATLKTLRERFPTVVFLLWTGERLERIDYNLPIVRLEPEIERTREETEYGEFRGARRAMRG